MWVTSGCESAFAFSASICSGVYSWSAMVVLGTPVRSGGLAVAARGEVVFDARFHRLVDAVEEQHRRRQQERYRAIEAHRQADSVDGGLRLHRTAGLVAVARQDPGDQRAADRQADLEAAQDGGEDD